MPTPAVLNVGFYNYVMSDKIVALVSSESAPMRRLIQTLRKEGNLIDATQGRRTKSVIFTSGSAVILSAISQETLAKRLNTGETTGSSGHSSEGIEEDDELEDSLDAESEPSETLKSSSRPKPSGKGGLDAMPDEE